MSAPNASIEQLATELATVIKPGASVTALRECPGVIALEVVRYKAASDDNADRAVAAHGLLKGITRDVDGKPGGPIATLFALAPGTAGSLLKDRRAQIHELTELTIDHIRSYAEARWVGTVASDLFRVDSEFRRRQAHRTQAERQPMASALKIDWYELHMAYRRVWTPLKAMRNDVDVLLQLQRERAEWPDLADRTMNISWRYAQFSREEERFVEDRAGTWLLSDLDSEIEATNSLFRAKAHLPLGEADISWLRVTLSEIPQGELDPFIDVLLSTRERADELMHGWLRWAESCRCNLRQPDPDSCEVHLWANHSDRFIHLIDEDWVKVADYYRATDVVLSGERLSDVWDDKRRLERRSGTTGRS